MMKTKILVIEDDKDINEMLTKLLISNSTPSLLINSRVPFNTCTSISSVAIVLLPLLGLLTSIFSIFIHLKHKIINTTTHTKNIGTINFFFTEDHLI